MKENKEFEKLWSIYLDKLGKIKIGKIVSPNGKRLFMHFMYDKDMARGFFELGQRTK
jgi:hypothetical protein